MKDLKISQKCWSVDLDKIEEGFLFSEQSVYAETNSKARSLLMANGVCEYMQVIKTDEDATYLTLPVRRNKQGDKYFFEDEEFTYAQIVHIRKRREREAKLQSILDNEKITHCYINKGGYYCPNYCGYTDILSQAGVYTKEDAIRHAKSCDRVDVIPIDVAKHNEIINNEIESLKTRLI